MLMSDYLIARSMLNASVDGGSGGYCIGWNGDIEGRDFIDLSDLGAGKLYKVSDAILDTEQLNGADLIVKLVTNDGIVQHQVMQPSDGEALGGDGWAAYATEGAPMVVSGCAGMHSYLVFDIYIPSDGTFFMYEVGDFEVFVRTLCKTDA